MRGTYSIHIHVFKVCLRSFGLSARAGVVRKPHRRYGLCRCRTLYLRPVDRLGDEAGHIQSYGNTHTVPKQRTQSRAVLIPIRFNFV